MHGCDEPNQDPGIPCSHSIEMRGLQFQKAAEATEAQLVGKRVSPVWGGVG